MRRSISYILLIISFVTVVVWAISQFIQPILPNTVNSGLVLFFSALIAVVGLFAGFKETIELFDILTRGKKKSPFTTALLSEFRQQYYQALKNRHRVFNVLGLNTQGAFPLELERIFVDLRIVPRNPQAISADLLHKGVPFARLSIWDVLSSEEQEYKTLAVLGPPGSGKTTLLRHLVMSFVENTQHKYGSHLHVITPIFLFLRDHRQQIISENPPTLAELAAAQEPTLDSPSEWFKLNLNKKSCLVLLDGFDEVADKHERQKVGAWVDRQIELYAGNRFIITSRPHGYKTTPLRHATILEVQPFTMEQVEKFVNNWFLAIKGLEHLLPKSVDVGTIISDRGNNLMYRLRQSAALRALSVNPLLLTMITMVNTYRSKLPERRVDLYEEICEVLLENWHSAIGLKQFLSAKEKRKILQKLAFFMMEKKRRELKTSEAVEIISVLLREASTYIPVEFLHEIEKESGLLLERELGVYGFAHQSFQEYLASVELLEVRNYRSLRQYIVDPWWYNAICLYAAQRDKASVFL